jgi:DNA-binding LytR/AlgR family response regulator
VFGIISAKLTCMIIDDEEHALESMIRQVNKTPNLELIYSDVNPVQALDFLRKNSIDLVFLDVQMPDLNGIDFMRLAGRNQMFILCTAHPNYALTGYDYDIVDYLLKPVEYSRFLEAVHKAHRLKASLNTLPPPPAYIKLNTDDGELQIDFDDLIYVESARNYVNIYKRNAKLLYRTPLNAFADMLPEQIFIRVSNSCLVNKNFVHKIKGNLLYLTDVKEGIVIGITYRQTVFNAFK